MHIAISGNIGSGKTTLTAKLAKHYNWVAQFEPVESNPYLEDFYKDMERWSFNLQIQFLNSRFDHIRNIHKNSNTIIQDRTIYEDAYIFAATLNRSKILSERDYRTYMDLFESMAEFIKPPDLLIYLRADIPKLVEQIQKRGRIYEESLRLNYLKELNAHYEAWIQNYTLGKVLIIDVNKIDFIKKVEDFALIINKIDVELNGLFSQNQ
jgi:deoxyadenosine/deoxycytidine kinase